MTLPRLLPALALLGALATPASSQSQAGPVYVWAFQGVTFSACVDFLMDSGMAAGQLAQGYQAIPAANFVSLAPVLRREIERDTILRGWIPAQVCFVEAPTMTSGDALLTPEGKMGTREMLGYWAIAGSRTGVASAPDGWFVAQYWTNDWRMQKRTEAAFIPMSVVKRKMVLVPESTNTEYAVTIGKTVLSWKGQMAGRDSTAYAEPRTATQIFTGKRSLEMTATVTATPQWSRTLPGVFHVAGKDDLAMALKGSPIRMFGPMYWGGDARVEFIRQ
jgi:hypothetical protein